MYSITRNNMSPKNKQIFLLNGLPEDMEAYRDYLTDIIFSLGDIAVFVMEPKDQFDLNLEEKLMECQAVITIVSESFLSCDSLYSRVHRLATEAHIRSFPCVPEECIESEDALASFLYLYEERLGKTEYLVLGDNCVQRETISKKLGKMVLGPVQIKLIKREFNGQIFLSYRKKNIEEAKQVIEAIRAHECTWDIAIWYDSYLTPGEDYEKEIQEAMDSSDLMALVVTSDIYELDNEGRDNYVTRVEYPYAMYRGLPILPMKMTELDETIFAQKYSGVKTLVGESDYETMQELLISCAESGRIRSDAKRQAEPVSMEEDFFAPFRVGDYWHKYMMGLAYLNGIGVEVDYNRALKLIKEAARGTIEANEKLVDMYYFGFGVERDIQVCLYYLLILYEVCMDCANRYPLPEHKRYYGLLAIEYLQFLFEDVCEVSGYQIEKKVLSDAETIAIQMLNYFQDDEEVVLESVNLLNLVAAKYSDDCEYDKARELYSIGMKYNSSTRLEGKILWINTFVKWAYNDLLRGTDVNLVIEGLDHSIKELLGMLQGVLSNEEYELLYMRAELVLAEAMFYRGQANYMSQFDSPATELFLLLFAEERFADSGHYYGILYRKTRNIKYQARRLEALCFEISCEIKLKKMPIAEQHLTEAFAILDTLHAEDRKTLQLKAKLFELKREM